MHFCFEIQNVVALLDHFSLQITTTTDFNYFKVLLGFESLSMKIEMSQKHCISPVIRN